VRPLASGFWWAGCVSAKIHPPYVLLDISPIDEVILGVVLGALLGLSPDLVSR
jgi:hypothetical protein